MRTEKISGTGAVVLVVALLTATQVWAVCGTEISNTSSSSLEYFGLEAGGGRSWVGQQFTTDCEGQFLSARFLVSLDLFPLSGVDPLTGGDTVTCTVMDASHQAIASVDAVLADGTGTQWVEFDFSALDIGLAAGTLGVKIETSAAAFGRVATDLDVAPGNLLVGNGTSVFDLPGADAAFGVTWDPSAIVVGTDQRSWGKVKALFR